MVRRRRRFRSPEPRLVTIDSMSHEGRGIARVNGKTVFVFGALQGETVRIQVQQSNRGFDQATTLEVLEPSPKRIQPRCAAFQSCGGCSLQHLDNEDQLILKQQALLDMFAHAGIEFDHLIPALRGKAWGYRKKARLGVKYVARKGRVLVGFRERNAPFIADMRSCEVLLPEVGHRLDLLADMIGRLDARAQIPQIEVAANDDDVQLVFRHLQPLSEHDLALLRDFGSEHGFLVQLQPGGPETVHNLYPERQLLEFDPVGDGRIRIGFNAVDFVQVNSEINRGMVAQALELLDLQPEDRVLDLFCGLGNFTLPMAQRCLRVTGIEADQAMVARARASAIANKIDNTEYFVGDLSSPEPELQWMQASYDKILLDPPRSGAIDIAHHIGRFNALRIVYVSCQPSSLVRDAGIICTQGYHMTYLGIMDMFPQTAHVESMAVFERKPGGAT
ncbi:MAG: 23S rRNA (uracil(1939)-C(5))-methyltransferase RlmD [Gammaproteobacteria bacterium]|nr:23S rRNA (uracil(1939)-C(5))-methyltransferase RlmD [Gammaproteobacteria bacterium]MDH3447047.1 23S rRNA (uracil(1939)-C(5))-methyltransferase RlmD [Gammaproteobacteria bacterium]